MTRTLATLAAALCLGGCFSSPVREDIFYGVTAPSAAVERGSGPVLAVAELAKVPRVPAATQAEGAAVRVSVLIETLAIVRSSSSVSSLPGV